MEKIHKVTRVRVEHIAEVTEEEAEELTDYAEEKEEKEEEKELTDAQIKRKKFDDAVFDFVMQSLRSGVGSAVKTLNERHKKWKTDFTDHTYIFPSMKTIQLLVQ